MVSEVKVPTLVKLQFLKDGLDLKEMADLLREYGHRKISAAKHFVLPTD